MSLLTSARRGPGLGTPRALPGARNATRYVTKVAGQLSRQPLRFPPRACTRKMRRHFSRQAPHAVFAPVGRSPVPPPHIAAKLAANVAAICSAPCVPLHVVRLVRESGVIDRADDAAPSRAWPRRNVGSNYVRPATGQRRITARVMRSFGRRLPHTLPFPAHPRVRLRSKKAARALATFFELRRTLRAGTESVLFPWRCFR